MASDWKPRRTPADAEPRNTAFSIGVSEIQYAMRSGEELNLLGGGNTINLGYGYISHNWFLNFSIDIYSGPYQAPNQQASKLDFSGTGFSVTLNHSAENTSIRSFEGNYGFSIGLSYTDIVGRAPGERRQTLEDQSTRTVDKYVMRANNFTLVPGIFFAWLEKSRPPGNSPELLKTRLEGYLLSLGFALPLRARYTVRYDQINTVEATSGEDEGVDSDVDTTELPGLTSVKEKGHLSGYAVLIAFTAFLGI